MRLTGSSGFSVCSDYGKGVRVFPAEARSMFSTVRFIVCYTFSIAVINLGELAALCLCLGLLVLSLIDICRCRRYAVCTLRVLPLY